MTDISWCEGLFVGSLDSAEIRAFDDACQRGEAFRSYEGAGGFLGLAKVRFVPANADTSDRQSIPGRDSSES